MAPRDAPHPHSPSWRTGWMRSLAAWSVHTLFGDVIFADIIRACREKPVDQYWKLAHEAKLFARRFIDEVCAHQLAP